jgi:hypothetical protein
LAHPKIKYQDHALTPSLTAAYNKKTAQRGAVTLIQRFGLAFNLNIHFHMPYLDGVYAEDSYGKTRFDDEHPCSPPYGQPVVVLIHSRWIGHPIKAPTKSELNSLTHCLSQRVAGFLEREGLLMRNDDNDYLALDGLEDDPMLQIHGYPITYRIATGKQQGWKVFTLQTMAPMVEQGLASGYASNVAGFSLHVGVMSSAQDRGKLERLCRYITRSGVSEKRLAITTYDKVRYPLKTPYRDGTTGDRRSLPSLSHWILLSV